MPCQCYARIEYREWQADRFGPGYTLAGESLDREGEEEMGVVVSTRFCADRIDVALESAVRSDFRSV